MNKFYNELKEVYKLNSVLKTKDFLENSLYEAISNKNTPLIITILNEIIGFYRDITEYSEGIKYTKSLINIISNYNIDSYSKFICYINIANSFRAASYIDEAIKYFDDAINIYNDNNLDDNINLAALYNNYALLYEELDLSKSIKYLNLALKLIKNSNDKIKIATTYVNLGFCYAKLNKLDEVLICINNASDIFKDNLNDFHISGFYNLKAKYNYLQEEYDDARLYYNKSLIHLKKTVGKNKQYDDTLKELFLVYDKLGIPYHKRGLLLAKEYYLSIENDLLNNIDKSLYNKICIGLFGLGSECYYLDDMISEDHDFEPNIIILVDDDVNKDDYQKILSSYNNLSKEFDRFYISNLDKHGVHYVDEYLKNYLGVSNINNINDESRSVITNGEIFYGNNSFTKLRIKLNNELKYKFIPELIYKTLEINQLFYNLNRCELRNDKLTYNLINNRLLDKVIELTYLENLLYKPHDKLAIKYISNKKINHLLWIYNITNNQTKDLEEEIVNYLLDKLLSYNIIKTKYSNYVEDYRLELLDYIDTYNLNQKLINHIVEYEWNMFTSLKNIGKRAECQDNYLYFKLMRESQYYVWNTDALKAYYNDLLIAIENKYNLLEIKYAFMEENVDINRFNSFKDRLPKLSDERIKVQEAIISLQLTHMNEFQNSNPEKAKMMRNIYSNLDTEDAISYETYLRGELSSYSENTLYQYGKMLAEYDNCDKNIVKMIIGFTYLFK